MKLSEAEIKLNYQSLLQLSDKILSSAEYVNSTGGVLSSRTRLNSILSDHFGLEDDIELI